MSDEEDGVQAGSSTAARSKKPENQIVLRNIIITRI
jgi:hypothetical protein